jgi:predicted transcriptional regulator
MTNARKYRYTNIFYKAMKKSKLTVRDFQKELGVAPMTLWRWLNYDKCPNLLSYKKINKVLKKYLPDQTFDIFSFKEQVERKKRNLKL